MRKTHDHGVKALAAIAERVAGNMDKHPVAQQLQAKIIRLHQAAAALDNVRANRSPLDTPEAHALKVAKLARKFDDQVLAVMNESGAIMRAGNQDVQRRIDEKVNLKPDAFASEIRAAFRTMGKTDQVKLLKQMIDEKRGPELAAIVKSPALLTGLSEEMQTTFESAFLSRHAPDEVAELQSLNEVFDRAMSANIAAGRIAKRFTDPAELARIESAEAASQEAGEAFNQSLQ